MKGFGQTVSANPPYCVPSSRSRETRVDGLRGAMGFRLEGVLENIADEYL